MNERPVIGEVEGPRPGEIGLRQFAPCPMNPMTGTRPGGAPAKLQGFGSGPDCPDFVLRSRRRLDHSGMDPRVEPEKDEWEKGFDANPKRLPFAMDPPAFVVLGLDPRIHAGTPTQPPALTGPSKDATASGLSAARGLE